jgi:hypothetical protein
MRNRWSESLFCFVVGRIANGSERSIGESVRYAFPPPVLERESEESGFVAFLLRDCEKTESIDLDYFPELTPIVIGTSTERTKCSLLAVR